MCDQRVCVLVRSNLRESSTMPDGMPSHGAHNICVHARGAAVHASSLRTCHPSEQCAFHHAPWALTKLSARSQQHRSSSTSKLTLCLQVQAPPRATSVTTRCTQAWKGAHGEKVDEVVQEDLLRALRQGRPRALPLLHRCRVGRELVKLGLAPRAAAVVLVLAVRLERGRLDVHVPQRRGRAAHLVEVRV